MKKILFALLVSSLIFVNSFSVSKAQSAKAGSGTAPVSAGVSSANIMMPRPIMPPPTQTSQPFGQNHNYSVTLRGNGEAFVTLKAVFSNIQEASLSALKVTFPTTPRDITIYQVNREPQCVMYKPLPMQTQPAKTLIQNDTNMSFIAPPTYSPSIYPPPSQECEQYQEPDYQYGWGGNTTYQKADYQLMGNTATINLPREIKPNGSGSYILMYRTSGFIKKDIFGAYNFAFETLKVPDLIQNLQIGISADPDYYLKVTNEIINYQTPTSEAMPVNIASTGTALSNAQFDTYYQQIGLGSYVKNATNLQPEDSSTVKGSYADSKAKLYGNEIVIGLGAIVVFILFALFTIISGVKKILKKTVPPPSQNQPVIKEKTTDKFPLFTLFGLSFGSSIFILLYSGFLYLISYYFGQVFQYYSYNFIYPILVILLLVISLCIYSVFLFVPGIFVSIKKGLFAGLATILLTIFWLFCFSIIIAGFFLLFFHNTSSFQPPYQGGILPMMEKSSTPVAAQ